MKLTLHHTREEGSDVRSFFFKADEPITWKAGQYLHYTLAHPNPDSRKTERYFTNAAAPHEGFIMLTTRFAGEKSSSFKKALFAMSIGSTIEATEPEGDFTVDDYSRPLVCIAGGIGITPFRSILLDLNKKGIALHTDLLYANRTEDVVYRQELEDLTAHESTLKIIYFIGDNKIDEAVIRKMYTDLQAPLFLISGPEPMVEAFEKMLITMGIPDAHIKRDYFPGYDWP